MKIGITPVRKPLPSRLETVTVRFLAESSPSHRKPVYYASPGSGSKRYRLNC